MPYKTKGEVNRFLVGHGCELISNKGKHEKWQNKSTGKRFPVPRNGVNAEKTWLNILKQAGISDKA